MMRRFLPASRMLGAAAAITLLLGLVAACNDSNGGDSKTGSKAGAVSVQRTSKGNVLVDGSGHTLYTNNQDTATSVSCVAACAQIWPPAIATANAKGSNSELAEELGSVSRPDGSMQLTYDGKPMYTFSSDKAPGQVTGDGLTDNFQGKSFVWTVVRSDESTTPSSSSPSEKPAPYSNGY